MASAEALSPWGASRGLVARGLKTVMERAGRGWPFRDCCIFWNPRASIERLAESLQASPLPLWLPGLSEGEKAVFLAALWQRISSRERGLSALWITPGAYQAERVYLQLSGLLPEEQVKLFPALDTMPSEEARPSLELTGRRLAALTRLALGRPTIVVAPVDAVAARLIPVERFRALPLPVRVGASLSLETLPERLVAMGYQRVTRVDSPGLFAIRGRYRRRLSSGRPGPHPH